MESRWLQKAVRLAVGPGRPPVVPLGQTGRALHTGGRPAHPQPTTLITRLVHRILPRSLHAPKPSPPAPQPFAYRGVHTSRPTLSLPARQFLAQARPTHHLPKPPRVSRGTHQVGLGAARNFSSARPVFQSLVENVPIGVRAFSQADVDLRKGNAKTKKTMRKADKVKNAKKEMNKPKMENIVSSLASSAAEPAELARYFPTPASPITHILVPLSPSSVSSPVFSPFNSNSESFTDTLVQNHSEHSNHSARVTSLLTRLSRTAPSPLYSELFGGDGQPEWLRLTYTASYAEAEDWLGEASRWVEVVEESPPSPLPDPLTDELVFPELDLSFSADFLDRLPVGTLAAMPEVENHWEYLPATTVYTGYEADIDSPFGGLTRASSPHQVDEEMLSEPDVLSESESHFSLVGSSDDDSWLAFSSDFERRRGQVLRAR